MTALALTPVSTPRWTPRLVVGGYDRVASLTPQERRALALLEAHNYFWPAGAQALGRLTRPLNDALAVISSNPKWWARSRVRSLLLGGCLEHGTAFWGWEPKHWLHTVQAADSDCRQVVAAVAYLLCDQRDLHHAIPRCKTGLLARRVFGAGVVDASLARVQGHLDGMGHSTTLRRPHLQRALYEVMLLAGSPLLEDFADQGELLARVRTGEHNNARRHGIEQLTRTLVEMGVIAQMPFSTRPSREEWLARSQAGEIEVPGRVA